MSSRDEKYLRMLDGMIEDPKECPYNGPSCSKRIKLEIRLCEKCKHKKQGDK